MKYVMVTDWREHWDRLPGGRASYTMKMFVPPMAAKHLKDGTRTTFLLFSKPPRKPLRAWTGKVTGIELTGDSRPDNYRVGYSRSVPAVTFTVHLSREIRFPSKHAALADGWYVEEPDSDAAGLW